MTGLPQTRNAQIADPGGVRGIHALVSMARVTQKTGKFPHELYSLSAGASVGIIALSLVLMPDPENPGKPKYTPEQAVGIFEEFARIAFPPPTLAGTLRQLFSDKAKHSATAFEGALEKIFGDTRVNQLLGNPMFYVTDARSGGTICIHHIRGEDGKVFSEELSNMRVRDVIRGGVTAPTFYEVRWDYPVNPDDPASRKIGLMDGGNAAGNIPHEVYKTLTKIAPPGARCVLSHYRTGRARHERDETRKKPLLGGLLGYIIYGDKRDHYLSWTFNAPNNRTSKIFAMFHPGDYLAFEATINRRQFPEHPTMHLDDASPDNMRRHRLRMSERLDEMEKDGSLDRHCADLMERFRAPEPAPLATPEKSGPLWKRPEVAEALRGFGVPLVRVWEKTKTAAARVVNENLPRQEKPKLKLPGRKG